jgi:nucleoside-diphosphate-sugar epimerase
MTMTSINASGTSIPTRSPSLRMLYTQTFLPSTRLLKRFRAATGAPLETSGTLADIRLAEKQLGYEVQVDFREGLHKTVEWYRSS